ncbi:MAG: hypothetical protein LUH13_00550, partial [Oscillospiraceae bacterium]|nr:hypothetical protein [Oscillospiraceae bacterium]
MEILQRHAEIAAQRARTFGLAADFDPPPRQEPDPVPAGAKADVPETAPPPGFCASRARFYSAHWQEKFSGTAKKTLDKLRVSCYDFLTCGCSSMV